MAGRLYSLAYSPVCRAAHARPDVSHVPTLPVAPVHPDAPLEFCHPDAALDPLGGVPAGSTLATNGPWVMAASTLAAD